MPQVKQVAVSGDATIEGIPQPRPSYVQIAVEPVSGSGTVTLKVKGAGESTFKTLAGDSEINLASPQTVTVTGMIAGVEATSSGLDYTLIVSTPS
jgi:hypothetical protein